MTRHHDLKNWGILNCWEDMNFYAVDPAVISINYYFAMSQVSWERSEYKI